MTEDQLHIQVADYLRALNITFHHSANQARAGVAWHVKRKRMGMLPGVADIQLMLAYRVPHYIELKIEGGRQSKSQKIFQNLCYSLGYPYVVCRSIEDLTETLKQWELIK